MEPAIAILLIITGLGMIGFWVMHALKGGLPRGISTIEKINKIGPDPALVIANEADKLAKEQNITTQDALEIIYAEIDNNDFSRFFTSEKIRKSYKGGQKHEEERLRQRKETPRSNLSPDEFAPKATRKYNPQTGRIE